MDPLSDVLQLVRPRGYASGELTAGGRWSVGFDGHPGIKCYVVTKGECLAVVDGVTEVRLATGDFLMLPHGRAFRLCTDVDLPPVDARTLFPNVGYRHNGTNAIAPGDDFHLIGGHFALEGNADFLVNDLPPVVHLSKESDKPALRVAIQRIIDELRDPQPGGYLLAQQSVSTMLVLALRLYLSSAERGVGWLFALADGQIARVIGAIHERPADAWTVQSLAEVAAMSRTAFAERFRRVVGVSPLDYVTRWRMMLAADRLRQSNDSIASVAQSVGYESESAFGAAFKRTMGSSPREYARARA